MKIIFALILALAGCGQKGDLVFKDPDASKNAKATSVSSNYDSIRANIFVPKCISCHDEGAASPHGIDLTTYENILDQSMFPPLVTPGGPEDSSLYHAVGPEGSMPKNQPRLSENEVKAIYDWIKKGAKETEEANSDSNSL